MVATLEQPKAASPLPGYAGAEMSAEAFFDLPDDGVRRALIDGRVVVYYDGEQAMTTRGKVHSLVESRVDFALRRWVQNQPQPRGEVFCGEVAVKLTGSGNAVGVDVAYLSPQQMASDNPGVRHIEGPPTLVVEILLPSDRQGDVDQRVNLFREAGVAVLWIVSPAQRSIVAHQVGQAPRIYTEDETLTAEPHLPGFAAKVRDLLDG